jgi:aminoglycoside 6'-N-acetyltransferase I
MTIRLVEPQDQSQWLALRSALWPHCLPERHVREMRDYASRGGSFATFVACLSNHDVCGFLEASLRESAEACASTPVGYIEGIYVHPNVRLRGIGRSLVAAAERWMRENGATEAGSDCHLENDASLCFHLRAGFSAARRIIHFRKTLPALE